jgi:hypothetical protein
MVVNLRELLECSHPIFPLTVGGDAAMLHAWTMTQSAALHA